MTEAFFGCRYHVKSPRPFSTTIGCSTKLALAFGVKAPGDAGDFEKKRFHVAPDWWPHMAWARESRAEPRASRRAQIPPTLCCPPPTSPDDFWTRPRKRAIALLLLYINTVIKVRLFHYDSDQGFVRVCTCVRACVCVCHKPSKIIAI